MSTEREFSVGPINVRLRGKQVETTVTASPSEFAQMRAHFAEQKRRAPDDFCREMEDVMKAIEDVDSLTVLGAIFFRYHLAPALFGKEMKESFALVEHMALLLAKRDGNGEKFVLDRSASAVVFSYLQDHLNAAAFFAFPDMPDDLSDEPDPILDAVVNVRTWEMGVRVPRYDHHQKALLRSLFVPFAGTLRETLGFTCEDAMAVEEAFVRSIKETAREGMDQARTVLRDVGRGLKGAAVGGDAHGIVKMMLGSNVQDPMPLVRSMLGAWLGFRTGHSLGMTVEDVSNRTALPAVTVQRVLDTITTTSEDLRDYFHIVPVNPLKSKPLVEIDGVYVMPSPGLFLPALQVLFEDALKKTAAWHTYDNHRKDFSEERAGTLLGRVLPNALVLRNVKYPGGELDVMVAFERRLFLVEVKGGGFAKRARVGVDKLLKANLHDLVLRAHEQARRAAEYIKSSDTVTFRNDSGNFTIRSADYNRVHLIAVTLEQIGHLVNGLGSLVTRGGEDVPWTVAMDDLETVTDVLTRPAQFVHYLEGREAILRVPAISGQDELGFLEWYLRTSLREVPQQFGDAQVVMMDAASPTIDAFGNAKARGEDPPVPPQALPELVLRLVDGLAAARCDGWLDAGIALLEMPHALQRSLARQMLKIDRGGGKTEMHVVAYDGNSDVTVRIVGSQSRTSDVPGWLIEVDRAWNVVGLRKPRAR